MKFEVVESKSYVVESTGQTNWSWLYLIGTPESGRSVRVPLGDTSTATIEKAKAILREHLGSTA